MKLTMTPATSKIVAMKNMNYNKHMDNQKLETEIKNIKARNARVDLDKKWETSWTRKICICILTYIVVVIYSFTIQKVSNPFLSSIVPVIGFMLSTLSLKGVRKIWETASK